MLNHKLFNISNMNITNRIIEKMKETGLKQVDLASLTKASKGTVSLWVKGQTVPSGDNLIKLANALKVTPEWLQTGKESRVRGEPARFIDGDNEAMLKLATMMLPVSTPNSNAYLQRIIEGLEQSQIHYTEKKELEVMLKIMAERFFPKGNP